MKKGISTQAIHGRKDKSFRSVNFPIYSSTTFEVEKSDDYEANLQSDEFYMYGRYKNPTTTNVEEKLALLEKTDKALLFSSGMSAVTTTLLTFVKQGDTIASSKSIYGASYRFMRDILPNLGVKVEFFKEEDLYQADKLAPHAKVIYFETPVNPTAKCVSIKKVVDAAKRINALTIMDNTFASPINQNPADFGVDIVLHSATKYLGGHSDVMAGAVMGPQNLIEKIYGMRLILGGIISPYDSNLINRSLKTLKVRVLEQNNTALRLAEFFSNERSVKSVSYPGLKSSPDYEVACSQMRGFGGMLCIDLGSLEAAKKLCDNVSIALNATSLGGAETLLSIPVLTSHIKMSDEELSSAGVSPGMVRISVGLEDAEDLIGDFMATLSVLGKKQQQA